MERRPADQGPSGDLWPWNWPLSGDVAQSFGTWWIKSLSAQTGFINVNNLQSGNPQVEQRIIQEVASYGRQLGWIMEALDGECFDKTGVYETIRNLGTASRPGSTEG